MNGASPEPPPESAPLKPYVAGAGLAVLGALLLYFTGGNPLLIPALCVALGALALLARRLEFSIYLMLGAALLLEQFQIFGIRDITTQKIPFFLNLNLTTGIGALVFNPIELLLGLTFALWFVRAAVSREWHLYPVPNAGIALLFLGMLIFFTGFGLARGGNWKVALWEIRALYYLCAMYFFTTQLIRTRHQVRVCVGIVLGMVAIKGFQGCYRYFVTLHGDLTGIRAITGHEDALFIVTTFVFGLALALLGYKGPELRLIAATLPTTFLTYLWAQRRITYGAFGISVAILVALLPADRRRLALKALAPLALLLLVYVGAFWNSGSKLGMPVQKLKSVFVEKKGTEDESSNFYRKAELVNLKYTLHQHPLGLGFGRKYLIIMPLDKVDFPLWDYIPHNCIYWMWVKTGCVGFLIFWLFFGVAIVQALIDYRAMRDPYFKALALMVLCFIASQLIVAYYDLQITFFRNMLYLGTAMALATVVRRIEAEEDAGGAPPAGRNQP